MEDVGENVDTEAVEKNIRQAKIRLQSRSPFFGTLCYFAEFRVTTEVPTAATDGRDVMINPRFSGLLRAAELDALLLHEVLHAALLHTKCNGDRDPYQWNVAADLVVNGIIDKQKGLDLPPGPVRSPDLEGRRIEKIYSLLDESEHEHLLELSDEWNDLLWQEEQGRKSPTETDLESKWRTALQEAKVVWPTGEPRESLPDGLERHVDSVPKSQIDWGDTLDLDHNLIIQGNRADVEWPDEPSRRYAVTMGLGTRISTAEETVRCFKWLLRKGTVEFAQLFAQNAFAQMRREEEMDALARRIQEVPRLKAFAEEMQELSDELAE